MCRWIIAELGPDVPHHFSAFHPDHRMRDVPATPRCAHWCGPSEIALEEGLHFVYTGNLRQRRGGDHPVFRLRPPSSSATATASVAYRLAADGSCPRCHRVLPGRFAAHAEDFGPQRIPISIGA